MHGQKKIKCLSEVVLTLVSEIDTTLVSEIDTINHLLYFSVKGVGFC